MGLEKMKGFAGTLILSQMKKELCISKPKRKFRYIGFWQNIEKLPNELVDKERWGKLKNRGQGGQDGRPEEVKPETSERVQKIISVIS